MDGCLYHMIEFKPQHNREQLENLCVYNSVTRKVPQNKVAVHLNSLPGVCFMFPGVSIPGLDLTNPRFASPADYLD